MANRLVSVDDNFDLPGAVSERLIEHDSPSGAALREIFAQAEILPVNVQSPLFGADATGLRDAAPAMNAASHGGNRDIYIPAGRYLLKSAIRLYRNTRVTMHPDAILLNDNLTHEYVFVNGELGNPTYASGYAGDGNIWISGGQIDNAARTARKQYTQAICIGHAENVLIENVQFRNNYSSHFIEINSSRHVIIRNCTFENLDAAGASNREAINVDYSYAAGFPAFGGYDGTNVDGLTIQDCTFNSVQVGVGTHSGGAAKHRNIRILNNTFTNVSDTAIHSWGWHNFLIMGNVFDGVQRFAAALEESTSGRVIHNYATNIGLLAHNTHAVFRTSGGSGNFMGPNRVAENAGVAKYGIAYQIFSGIHSIDTTGADAGSWGRAHTVEKVSSGSVVDGVSVYNLSDDTAAVFRIKTQENQGMVMVTMQSDQDFSPRGIYWVRAYGTPDNSTAPIVRPAAAVAAPNLNLTTGVLSGTTGADGKVTMSADNSGNLYIENRTGQERKVGIRWMGSAW